MNKQRRKDIADVVAELEALKARAEELKEEEQEYLDNMPESFQQGDKGEAAQEAVSNIEYAVDSIGEAIENLGSVE